MLIRHLSETGVSPDDIHKVIPWRGTGLWRKVEGHVDSAEFTSQATAAAVAGGPAFDPGRWFCADDELIRHEQWTYALTKMWGDRFDEAVRELRESFPRDTVSIVPTAEEL